jgi:FkbM family methyltransferase
MFNNCDSRTNGEVAFYNLIRNNIRTIFDVGCRSDSEFTTFKGEVHYFDPVAHFIENLKTQKNSNAVSYFNAFGLGDEAKEVYYYPRYQSFYDRVNSCKVSDETNKILLQIKTGKEYVTTKNICHVDFLKIDTEGYELNVLKGFDDFLKNINLIQFEYGGTFLDNNTKLIDIVSYLQSYGFDKFSYLSGTGPVPITNFDDHYQYCNVVCINKQSDYIPY